MPVNQAEKEHKERLKQEREKKRNIRLNEVLNNEDRYDRLINRLSESFIDRYKYEEGVYYDMYTLSGEVEEWLDKIKNTLPFWEENKDNYRYDVFDTILYKLGEV